MLRLITGETVALLGSYGSGESVAVLTDSPGDPDAVIKNFTALTGYPIGKVARI